MTRTDARAAREQADTPERLRAHLAGRQAEMVDLLIRLAKAESPSTDASTQRQVFECLAGPLVAAGMSTRWLAGRRTGGQMFASPQRPRASRPFQLLVGHCDTVWPVGTVVEMPIVAEGDTVRGPGVFDMKAGLVQGIFALAALHELGLELDVAPVFFITSDEEIGSVESDRRIAELARRACRALVLEPALGLDGRIKTSRKGVGQFEVRVIGRSAHSGLAPEEGASAILELASVIQRLHALADPRRGITINVGVIEGGLRPNVVAPASRAEVDVRVRSERDAREIDRAIRSLAATTPGTRLEIEGGIGRGPMEPTPRNQALWRAAREEGRRLGIELIDGESGGASDGNITSCHTATLDGLGAVGDGAHAINEFVYASKMVERATLLALILLLPTGAADTTAADT